jgi:CheY-like chemotaxis protein
MSKQKNILVAEDSITGRNQIKKHLTNHGYEITEAANGREALAAFDRTIFSVVITDLVMPEMDGAELIEKLKRIAPEVIIVFLTSHENSELIIEIMKKGVFDYIVKPIRLDKLIITIERAFHFSSLNKIKHKQDRESFKKTLISNLHRGFNQGAGIGNQLSIIKMILSQAVHDGENFIIDKKLYSIIKDSERVTNHIIKKIYELEQILKNPFPLSLKTADTIASLIEKCTDDLNKFVVINKNSIKLIQPAEGREREILCNEIYLKVAIEEIVINAMKFSQPESNITIVMSCQKRHFGEDRGP